MCQKICILFDTIIVALFALKSFPALPMLAQKLITGEQIGFEFVIVLDSAAAHRLLRLDIEIITTTWSNWNRNLEAILTFSRPTLVFLVPTNTTHFLKTLEQVGNLLKKDLNPWLTWTPIFFIAWPTEQSQNMSLLYQYLQANSNLTFPLDTDIFIIQSLEDLESSKVYEIFGQTKRSNIRYITMESELHFNTFSNYLPKSVRRQNFNLARIRCVGLSDPSYQMQLSYQEMNGSVIFNSGLSVRFLKDLEYTLNFSHVAVAGEGWIEQLENGTWLGMAKQLQNDEADVAITNSMFLSYRLTGLDFLHSTSFGTINAFFRQPSASSIRDIFITPFSLDLWICLLLLWLLLISALIVMYWIRLTWTDVEVCDTIMVDESFLWTIGTLCQKGWHVTPSNVSMKIVFMFGSLVGLVYYVAFSASLVSTLSIKVIPIKTLIDLAQSQIQILGDFWLPNSPAIVEEIEKSRYNYIKPNKKDQYIEIQDAIPRLLDQPAAYLTFNDGFLTVFHTFNYSDQFYCSTFSAIPVSQAPLCSGFAVKKGSPYREFFNHKILMMHERGASFRHNKIYFRDTSARCSQQRSNRGEGLGLYDVITAFFLLLGGYGLSLIVAILERSAVTVNIYAFLKIVFKRFKE